ESVYHLQGHVLLLLVVLRGVCLTSFLIQSSLGSEELVSWEVAVSEIELHLLAHLVRVCGSHCGGVECLVCDGCEQFNTFSIFSQPVEQDQKINECRRMARTVKKKMGRWLHSGTTLSDECFPLHLPREQDLESCSS